MNILKSANILGVNISTDKKSQLVDFIIKRLKASTEKTYIVTPNPEIIMYAVKHKEYKDLLNRAHVALPDGIGVLMAGKIMGKGIESRITGVDFMLELVKTCAEEGFVTGFFGGGSGVAVKTAECLQKTYPNLKVGFAGSQWDMKTTSNKENDRGIDVLFVALGFPKQEIWISENLKTINVKCAMGVGGAFDFISKKVPRAPKIIQSIGLEWLFRLVVQPWRIKRQIVLLEFMFRVVKFSIFKKI